MSTKIRIANIINDSIVDGPGIRLVVFTQGCHHHCLGCHNPSTHPLDGGREIDIEEIVVMAERNPLLSGITLSGGEPFLQVSGCLTLLKKLKPLLQDIIVYTGYQFEELLEKAKESIELAEFLQLIDFLIDGRFELARRDISLRFRGSSNQRIVDVKSSLKNKEVKSVHWD